MIRGQFDRATTDRINSAFVQTTDRAILAPLATVLCPFKNSLPALFRRANTLTSGRAFFNACQNIFLRFESIPISPGQNCIACIRSKFRKTLMPVFRFFSCDGISRSCQNLIARDHKTNVCQKKCFKSLANGFLFVCRLIGTINFFKWNHWPTLVV